MVSVMLCQ